MFDPFGDGASAFEWLARVALVGLGVSHGLTVWLNGSLFYRKRAELEARGGLRSELLLCRLCLSWPWTTGLVFFALWGCSACCPALGRLLLLAIYSLAAAHVAVLCRRIGDFDR